MASSEVVIRARKFQQNPLLGRRQFVVDAFHQGGATVSRNQMRKLIANKFSCPEENVIAFGLRTKFGGGLTTGYGLIYDSVDTLKKFESTVTLVKNGLKEKLKKKGRRLKKEEKNKKKKLFGVKKEKKN